MIPITRSSEHALRALTYLAREGAEGFCLVRDMAEELELPAPFLGKVLLPLVGRGILRSRRGRRGGYGLARPAAEITLYEIVDALEHLSGPQRCFLGQAECSDERACPLHEFWSQSSSAFLARLRGTTLADMVAFCEQTPESGYPFPRVRRPARG